ncbi:hypothetical protein [Enterococcus faecium]|uniref:hypothetical protein n=1 Tax=Enterococcus faecium TaxID=1352 RepID=UPI003CE54E36
MLFFINLIFCVVYALIIKYLGKIEFHWLALYLEELYQVDLDESLDYARNKENEEEDKAEDLFDDLI